MNVISLCQHRAERSADFEIDNLAQRLARIAGRIFERPSQGWHVIPVPDADVIVHRTRIEFESDAWRIDVEGERVCIDGDRVAARKWMRESLAI